VVRHRQQDRAHDAKGRTDPRCLLYRIGVARRRKAFPAVGRAVRRHAVDVARRSEGREGRHETYGQKRPKAFRQSVHLPSRGTKDNGTFASTHPPVGGGNFADRNIPMTQLDTSTEWMASSRTEALQTLPCGSIRTLTMSLPCSAELTRRARS